VPVRLTNTGAVPPAGARRQARYCASPSCAEGWSGTSRVLPNLVWRMTKPSGVTSPVRQARASEMRNPVAKSSARTVLMVRGRRDPAGPSRAATAMSRRASSGV
jgi:hypothetical protein